MRQSNWPPAKIVNSSGFPLQVGVANVIREHKGWVLAAEEYPWRSSEAQDGFIDLIAIKNAPGISAVAIECKRVGGDWVFLVPEDRFQIGKNVIDGVFWYNKPDTSLLPQSKWQEIQSNPITYRSMYCAIPGQEQGRKNSIERTASILIKSVENIRHPSIFNISQKIIVPLVLTTAKLQVAKFDPTEISLRTGELPNDTEFEEVPYIRFHKCFSTEDTFGLSFLTLERTIFVVNAPFISEFLDVFEIL